MNCYSFSSKLGPLSVVSKDVEVREQFGRRNLNHFVNSQYKFWTIYL